MAKGLLKNAPKRKKRRTPQQFDEQYTGPEPAVEGTMTREELLNAFNYYAYHKNIKDAKKYIVDYLLELGSKDEARMVKACPEVFFIVTYGWLARMASRGVEHSLEVQEKLERHIEYLCTQGFRQQEKKDEAKEVRQQGPTIQDHIKEQAWDMGSELEKWKDMCASQGNTWAMVSLQNKPLDYLRGNGCNQAHARVLKGEYTKELDEITQAYKKTEEDLVEGYSHMSKQDKKRFMIFLQDVLDACDMIIGESVANRKQRTKKPASAEKQVTKLKYCVKDDKLKVVSEKPIALLGATAAVVYQIKFRKIGVLIADDSAGFTVKGTTLTNVNETKSTRKTLRKPIEQLKECKGLTKSKFDKWFTSLKAVETKLTPRFSDDTIILKIFK